MNDTALKLTNEIALNIVSGRDKGISYKLVGEVIKIGRAPDNDVVLDDAKSSRYHARVESRNGDFWIVDSSSAHGIVVNGINLTEKMLTLGDQIIIGNTVIVYGPPAPILSLAPSFSSIGTKSNMPKILVIGVLIFGSFIYFTQNQTAKKKNYIIKDDNVISTEIENLSHDNEVREQEILKKGKDTQQYSEAQAFYLRGFRDFREENYGRAILSFETALTLYPEHPLAKKYLARSRLKLNESITASLERGEKYFQNQKYINAFDEYRNVILLTNDSNNKNVQLAQKRIEAINLILMNNR